MYRLQAVENRVATGPRWQTIPGQMLPVPVLPVGCSGVAIRLLTGVPARMKMLPERLVAIVDLCLYTETCVVVCIVKPCMSSVENSNRTVS